MRRRTVLRAAVGLSVLLAAAASLYVGRVARSGTGYEAQTLCAAVFVSGRDPADVMEAEFQGLHPLLRFVRLDLDRAGHAVRADLFGLGAQQATFRPGLGCTLTDTGTTLPPAPAALTAPWPDRPDALDGGVAEPPPGIDVTRLRQFAKQQVFSLDPEQPSKARAFLVLLHGRPVVERYAEGFTKATPLAGYSMTKTLVGALAGILAARGHLELTAPAPVAAWQTPGDPRAAITVWQLLRMTSGLSWDEDSGNPLSDVLVMLYHVRDMAGFAAGHALAGPPGTQWAYSSGTANILAGVLRTALHDDAAYLALPRTALFEPAGMRSAVLPPDGAGTLVGSSNAYATARDWARFGELFLHDGARNGVQVLPKGWVAAMTAPEEPGRRYGYGAALWINRGMPDHAQDRPHPELPEDLVMLLGHFGQLTAIIPSRDLVIVRLGETHDWNAARHPAQLVAAVLAALDGPG